MFGGEMSAKETSFKQLVGVPVHYDRLNQPNQYGSKGQARTFQCRNQLRSTLEQCFSELFNIWGRGVPSIILTAGTIGDGGGDHGRGYAFDLDGFYWGEKKFMMLEYPKDRPFYLGINAHLFLYFSQVLSYHYPSHADHFHVDFNFTSSFRPQSNAQTFFLQACLRYILNTDLGKTGQEKDGVDGIFGSDTEQALRTALKKIGVADKLTTAPGWKKFLKICREEAFAAGMAVS